MTFTPKHTRDWEKTVRDTCKAMIGRMRAAFDETWPVEDGDFEVAVSVFRARRIGDLDNYVKAVTDAINGVAFPDDGQICFLKASMALDRERPRVEVTVTRHPHGKYSGAKD